MTTEQLKRELRKQKKDGTSQTHESPEAPWALQRVYAQRAKKMTKPSVTEGEPPGQLLAFDDSWCMYRRVVA